MAFTVGETVVYPHHGAAHIEAIETRKIKGVDRTYLVLKVAQGDLTVRVPADNVEMVGVRDVVGQDGRGGVPADRCGLVGAGAVVARAGLGRFFGVLRPPHTEKPTNWSRRYKAN